MKDLKELMMKIDKFNSQQLNMLVEHIFDISNEEANYVIDSPAGQGIIVYGEDKVAFRNQVSKESYIYELNQTSNFQVNRS